MTTPVCPAELRAAADGNDRRAIAAAELGHARMAAAWRDAARRCREAAERLERERSSICEDLH